MSHIISITFIIAATCALVRFGAWMLGVEPLRRFAYGLVGAAFVALILAAHPLFQLVSELWSREAAFMLMVTGEHDMYVARLENLSACFAIACLVGELMYRAMQEFCWTPQDDWRR